jgi:D-sedoheptulose 7-phosphate isomerase
VSLPVAILAGGLATRLKPLTESIPKSLIELAGKPFAVHQIELLRRHGITRIVLCVGYLGEKIKTALGNGSSFEVDLEYVFDGPVLLGTGGALRKASSLLGRAFFVLYGDSYLDCDYAAIEHAFWASGKLGLMTVLRNLDQWDRSNVSFKEGRIQRYNKNRRTSDMEYIDYGLGVLQAKVFDTYAENIPIDLVQIYQDLIARDELAAFEVTQRFYEIGSSAGLEETPRFLEQRKDIKMDYIRQYLNEANRIIAHLDIEGIERMVSMLVDLRNKNGRLFFLGVGGSAANCSHAVNDFRKIAGFESYTPSDNVSELTARTNDDGWDSVFVNWLRGSKLASKDGVLILSVGGGDSEKNISMNLIRALDYAKEVGTKIFGIVGRNGGYTSKVADACIIVPTVNSETVTAHTESFQSILLHLIVSHPALKVSEMKWEGLTK